MSILGIVASQNYPRTITVDYLVVAGGGGGAGNIGAGGGAGGLRCTVDATGGGGGGNDGSADAGGAGGSGIIVLRYPDTRTITFGAGVTGTESSPSGGYKRATITQATAGTVSWS
jgi:hypothetical protein